MRKPQGKLITFSLRVVLREFELTRKIIYLPLVALVASKDEIFACLNAAKFYLVARTAHARRQPIWFHFIV